MNQTYHQDPSYNRFNYRLHLVAAIFFTLLAGVNIYCMLDLFWYKGLEFKHYFFMALPAGVATLAWVLRPKKGS